jgi:hypothetical protein
VKTVSSEIDARVASAVSPPDEAHWLKPYTADGTLSLTPLSLTGAFAKRHMDVLEIAGRDDKFFQEP